MTKGSKFVWAFGGAVALASASFGVVACSSTTTNGGDPVPGPDASKADTGGGTTPDSSVVVPEGGNIEAGGGCASPPQLFKPSAKGLYCPFSKNPDGGTGAAYCTANSQVCCVSPSADAGSSVCAANQGACPAADSLWQCSAPQECGGGTPVCCLTAGPLEADPNCAGFQKTKGFYATTCTTAQACTGTVDAGKYIDNQYVVCEQQSDCTTGTCTPLKTSGTSIGLCL